MEHVPVDNLPPNSPLRKFLPLSAYPEKKVMGPGSQKKDWKSLGVDRPSFNDQTDMHEWRRRVPKWVDLIKETTLKSSSPSVPTRLIQHFGRTTINS